MRNQMHQKTFNNLTRRIYRILKAEESIGPEFCVKKRLVSDFQSSLLGRNKVWDVYANPLNQVAHHASRVLFWSKVKMN